jgi:hypothetical protein
MTPTKKSLANTNDQDEIAKKIMNASGANTRLSINKRLSSLKAFFSR